MLLKNVLEASKILIYYLRKKSRTLFSRILNFLRNFEAPQKFHFQVFDFYLTSEKELVAKINHNARQIIFAIHSELYLQAVRDIHPRDDLLVKIA